MAEDQPLARDVFSVGQRVRLSADGVAKRIHLGSQGRGIVVGFLRDSDHELWIRPDGNKRKGRYSMTAVDPDGE